MNNKEFAKKCEEIAKNYKTSYMLGCFGFLSNDSNITYSVNRPYLNNSRFKAGAESIKNDGWMFDCVCLIKAVLWGFNGNKSKTRGGGAVYNSNGVPDINADQMISRCNGVSTNFNGIEVGEVVWMKGHIGVYIGGGKVVECTPKWSVAPDGVKITNLGNLGYTSGRSRTWTKHGKLPYIEYVKEETTPTILTSANDITWELNHSFFPITETERFVKALEEAKQENSSLYWGYYKLVNKIKK